MYIIDFIGYFIEIRHSLATTQDLPGIPRPAPLIAYPAVLTLQHQELTD